MFPKQCILVFLMWCLWLCLLYITSVLLYTSLISPWHWNISTRFCCTVTACHVKRLRSCGCLYVTFSFHTFPFGIQLNANASPSAEYICHKLDLHTPQLPERCRITQSSALEKKHMSRGDWWLASRPLKRCEWNTNRLKKLIAALAREPFVVWIWCKALQKPQAVLCL